MNTIAGHLVSGPKSTSLKFEEKRAHCFQLTEMKCYLLVTAHHTASRQDIRTLAMSVSIVSCERSRVYSSEIAADASSVRVGFMHLAMWMYFFMKATLIILSLFKTKV
jgi:hypothetical protein